MPDSSSNNTASRIAFVVSSLMIVLVGGAGLRLAHAHPGSKRVLAVVGYALVVLGVLWTRRLEKRLKEAGLPGWSFWPYFLIVFTGCIGAFALKFANAIEALMLFLAFQLPAALVFGRPKPAESMPQGAQEERVSAPRAPKKRRLARKVTPLGGVEFAVYVLLIAGLVFVLHLLRGDVAGLAMPRWLRIALDVVSALLCVPWVLCVRGRLRSLGLTYWYPGFCSVVLVACVSLFALGAINFRLALILFGALQIPAVVLRRSFIPAAFAEVEDPEEAGAKV